MRNCKLVAVSILLAAGCSRQPTPIRPSEIGLRYTKAHAVMSEIEIVDGVYQKKGVDTPFTGLAIEFYENGTRKNESYFLDGKLHGPQIQWYRDGGLLSLSVHEDNSIKYLKEYGPDAVINK